MGRMTRAKAAEVAESLHIHEDALLEIPNDNPDKAGQEILDTLHRKPLGEIAGNSGSTKDDLDNEMRNTRAASKSRNIVEQDATSTNAISIDYTSVAQPEGQSGEVLPDIIESVPSPASEAAAKDLMRDEPMLQMSHLPVHDTKPTTPSSSAVRLTRSQLNSATANSPASIAKQRATELEHIPSAISTPSHNRVHFAPTVDLDIASDPAGGLQTETGVSYDQDSMPNTMQKSRGSPIQVNTPTKTEQDSMPSPAVSETVYDQLEAAVIEVRTPPRSTSQDAISALDELDDAVEMVVSQVPEVQTSPQKAKAKWEKPAPPVRTTKASQARISLAHGPKDTPRAPALGRPRQSLATSQTDAKRITSNSSMKSNGSATVEPAEKKEVAIPHSKPRPMSMSFPAPRPPPKSTKAPTQSNFQLPGEAIAAKLKAAKEVRLQKEAEEQKKKVFKARPAPSMTSKAVVRQTSTSKARESLMGGNKPAATPSTTHRRAASLASSRPASRPSIISKSTTAAGVVKKSFTASSAKPISVPKRASTALDMLSRPRPSTALSSKPNPPGTLHLRVKSNGSGTLKGKEVFNRAANAKTSAEQQKREKEEAAKKARAEAAERSRALSREWAEKQKAKKAGARASVVPAGAGA